MNSLNEFTYCSGLKPSLPKSTAFFSNVKVSIKQEIHEFMPFEFGCLPIKYLGVPLISSNLLNRNCKVLVERIANRVGDWKNKSLSFAGRLQLMRSVLSSMHVYWSSVFILPVSITSQIEKILRGFLWCQGELKTGKSKVSWEVICRPKDEGGLGIRSLDSWNKALMSTHLWNLLSRKESLWVKWIHCYRLKHYNFWEIRVKNDASFAWRKLLKLRHEIRPFIKYKIGDGKSCSAWYDSWDNQGPIRNIVSTKDISRASFSLDDTVSNIIHNNEWKWPVWWTAKYQQLLQFQVPSIRNNVKDCTVWRMENGVDSEFSVGIAWDSLRDRSFKIPWLHVVWFSKAIPRHAFFVWLIMLQKLKTQDKIRIWDKNPKVIFPTVCVLCSKMEETHNHLFFEKLVGKGSSFSKDGCDFG